MKPRRLLSSVDHMPTIQELQENVVQDYPIHSLEDYLDSIRELSLPAYPLSGPLQGSRLAAPRMARYPSMPSVGRGPGLVCRDWSSVVPDKLSLPLALRTDSRAPVCAKQDPLDWLFTQAQDGDCPLVENAGGDVCMI